MHGQPSFADIVVVTSGTPVAWVQINALRRALGPFPVIEVLPTPVKRRKRGLFVELSQLATGFLLGMRRKSALRKIETLIDAEGLRTGPDLDQYVMRLASANNLRFQDTLRRIGPTAVLVIDAGDISSATLNCVDAPFIRYHSSINPAASAEFGGYFALAAGDVSGFGASLHVIAADGGIGPLVAQQPVPVEKGDNIHTYPWRIAAHARVMVVRAMRDALVGRLQPQTVETPEPAFLKPPLGRYLGAGLTRGVW